MEPVQITCPSCQTQLRVSDGRSGTLTCPKCGSHIGADTKKIGSDEAKTYAQDWHESLLRSLSDTGVQRSPPARWPFILRMIVVALAAMFVYALYAAIENNLSPTSIPDQQLKPYLDTFFFIIFVLVIGALRVPVARLFRQRRARRAEKELEESKLRPILYLRSFNIDAPIARFFWIDRVLAGIFSFYYPATDEERLTKYFRKIGPLIAIGRPGEELPALGAARFYVNHDRWQEKVTDVVRVAQFVVWVSGITEGLRWELSHLIKSLSPSQLILWAHPHLLRLKGPKLEAEWRLFCERLAAIFPIPLPNRLGEARFFYFDAAFTPVAVFGNEYALWSRQGDAMRTLLLAKGLAKPKPIWAWRSTSRSVQLIFGLIAGFLAELALQLPALIVHYRLYGDLIGFRLAAFSCVTAAVWGILFVLAQSLLRRVPGGYWSGAALFAIGRKFVDTVALSSLAAFLFGGMSWIQKI